jgi:hypothetical protein
MTEFYREQMEKFEAELKNLMAKYQIEIEFATFKLGGYNFEWDEE